ncbi:MAG: Lrp/AsnC family transcriptional regulator [Devosiaceae bacterium]|nr:Lrp/AsnC family transcriptional regulator [Devosiaceae bacterium MH13]
MSDTTFDAIDRRILAALQDDATLSMNEIAARVGLSATPCWRRIQKLEEAGIIRRRVALLNGSKIAAGVAVFVSVRTNQHTDEWLRRFAEVVAAMPEVVEFYRLSGDIDYLLKVVVPDINAYDTFYKKLVAKVDLSDVSSSFAMEEIKYTTALPLEYMPVEKQRTTTSV